MDARQFNIRDGLGRLTCPACGYPNYASELAYDERQGLAGVTICPCCMWEPGFDDNPAASARAEGTIIASLRRYRSGWNGKAHWSGRASECPADWDGTEQLSRLFEIAPQVR
jgi:hypothetical protein